MRSKTLSDVDKNRKRKNFSEDKISLFIIDDPGALSLLLITPALLPWQYDRKTDDDGATASINSGEVVRDRKKRMMMLKLSSINPNKNILRNHLGQGFICQNCDS